MIDGNTCVYNQRLDILSSFIYPSIAVCTLFLSCILCIFVVLLFNNTNHLRKIKIHNRWQYMRI